MTVERREGLTPAGGVASEAIYLNDRGIEVEPDEATLVVVRELDEQGRLIAETFGTIDRGARQSRASATPESGG